MIIFNYVYLQTHIYILKIKIIYIMSSTNETNSCWDSLKDVPNSFSSSSAILNRALAISMESAIYRLDCNFRGEIFYMRGFPLPFSGFRTRDCQFLERRSRNLQYFENINF